MLRTFLRSKVFQNGIIKKIHTSSVSRIKEIYVEKQDKVTIIEAKIKESSRGPYLMKLDKNDKKCPLCQLKLDLKHTDVLILSQYIDSKGNILPKFATSLCKDQYKLVKELIYMAQHAGLLPEPPRDKKPYELLNTYYDEKTINIRPTRRKFDKRFHYLKLAPIEKSRVRPEEGPYHGPRYR